VDQPTDKEVVRYYPVDFATEKFPPRELMLRDFKDLTIQELQKLREKIEKVEQDILKKLGS